jgi:uncharacterized membrane protein YccC
VEDKMYRDEILFTICIGLAIAGIVLLFIGGQQNNNLPKLIIGGILFSSCFIITFIYAYKTHRFG